jgi:hypothetical protein
MKLIEDLNRILSEAISAADRKKLENLKPTDKLIVYHGTSERYISDLINGFDATNVHYRHFGGPRHNGLFITSDIDVAERFASYGRIILEIEVRAKNLHGTNYSGETRKEKFDDDTYSRRRYPNSFRSYLTHTMLNKEEPQGLLIGTVSPKQIKRIRYKESADVKPVWYTRKEFLKKNIEVQVDQFKKKKLKDVGYNLASTKHSAEKYMEIVSKTQMIPYSEVEKVIQRLVKRDFDYFANALNFVGFGEKALQSFYKKAKQYYAH